MNEKNENWAEFWTNEVLMKNKKWNWKSQAKIECGKCRNRKVKGKKKITVKEFCDYLEKSVSIN